MLKDTTQVIREALVIIARAVGYHNRLPDLKSKGSNENEARNSNRLGGRQQVSGRKTMTTVAGDEKPVEKDEPEPETSKDEQVVSPIALEDDGAMADDEANDSENDHESEGIQRDHDYIAVEQFQQFFGDHCQQLGSFALRFILRGSDYKEWTEEKIKLLYRMVEGIIGNSSRQEGHLTLPYVIMGGKIIINPIPSLKFAFRSQKDAQMFGESLEKALKVIQGKIEPSITDDWSLLLDELAWAKVKRSSWNERTRNLFFEYIHNCQHEIKPSPAIAFSNCTSDTFQLSDLRFYLSEDAAVNDRDEVLTYWNWLSQSYNHSGIFSQEQRRVLCILEKHFKIPPHLLEGENTAHDYIQVVENLSHCLWKEEWEPAQRVYLKRMQTYVGKSMLLGPIWQGAECLTVRGCYSFSTALRLFMKWRNQELVDDYSLCSIVMSKTGGGNYLNQAVLLLVQDYVQQVVVSRKLMLEQVEQKIAFMKQIKSSKTLQKEMSDLMKPQPQPMPTSRGESSIKQTSSGSSGVAELYESVIVKEEEDSSMSSSLSYSQRPPSRK